MKHLIIVRFFYNDKDLFIRRANLMKQTVIECLKKQTTQDFILCIMTDKDSVSQLKEILDYEFISFDDYTELLTFCKNNEVKIQTRHDSDDLMSDDYLEFIQSEYEINKNLYSSFLLHFNWQKIDFETGRIGDRSNFIDDSFISGFCSLCEFPVKNTVYARSHPEMGKIVEKTYTYDIGYVFYTQHPDNNSKIPREERIKISRFNKK